jgi:dTDP-4-dehydrorhamnose 3,5-epimerase
MMTITDVKLVSLEMHQDDRGYLYEIIHANDSFLPQFGQVYLVGDPVRNTIRAFHKHTELFDYFSIIHGRAKFVLIDDRKESSTYKEIDTFVLSDRKPELLVVPPGIFHGWMSLEYDTILISTASHLYNHDKPDEVRISPDSYGNVWEVKGR